MAQKSTITNGAILTAHEATVQTVEVSIRVMKVGKKQVTMGLFRQLPRDILLDPETLQLRGVPWGHVHYWWDGDGSRYMPRDKLHVVWQLGEVLKRAIVYETPHGDALDALEHAYKVCVEDWALVQVARAERIGISGTSSCDIVLDTRTFRVDLDPGERYMLAHYWGTHAPRGVGYSADTREQAAAGYAELLAARGLTVVTREEAYAACMAAARKRDAYKGEWMKQWEVLRMLPQLFIAV